MSQSTEVRRPEIRLIYIPGTCNIQYDWWSGPFDQVLHAWWKVCATVPCSLARIGSTTSYNIAWCMQLGDQQTNFHAEESRHYHRVQISRSFWKLNVMEKIVMYNNTGENHTQQFIVNTRQSERVLHSKTGKESLCFCMWKQNYIVV